MKKISGMLLSPALLALVILFELLFLRSAFYFFGFPWGRPETVAFYLKQNAYVERYNRTVRYDWLGQYLFDSITEVQDFATRWLWTYNHERPNMALGGFTPKQWLTMTT